MIQFHPADLAIIAAYIVFTIAVGMGFYHSRGSGVEDYLVAGRSVTLPAFVATLVATWYGGILGVGEYSYNYGLASWTVFGLPYYVFALAFAFFLAHRVREAALFTIPDRIAEHYGKGPAIIASIFAFIMVNPAPYVLMLGVMAQIVTGWPLWTCVTLGTIFSMFYVANGGLRTDIRVNVFQFVLMFAGFGLILPTAIVRYGGISFLRSHLPAANLTWTGGNSLQVLIVWFFIAVWTLVDPGFHQRCYAAKTPKTARNGILVSICFWFLFDFLTCTTGLYARAAMPNLNDPKMSYPMLAETILPPIAKGVFYVGMLATIMSTVLSYTFLGAVTLGRDIMWRYREEPNELNVTCYTRWGLVFTALLAIALALAMPSVVTLWYTIGSLCVPGLLAPVLNSYFLVRKMTPGACALCMTGSFGVSLGCMIWGNTHQLGGYPVYPLNLQPMLPGLAFSGLMMLMASKKQ